MERNRIYHHTIPKSGIAESTEYDIYALVCEKWGVNTNLHRNPFSDYEQLLVSAAALPSGVVVANIKEFNHIMSELTRLYRRIDIRFISIGYYYKVIISCFG